MMRKKQLCNHIVTGRILQANVTSKNGNFLTIAGDPVDVTYDAIIAVMTYMQERCESEGRKEITYARKGNGVLKFALEEGGEDERKENYKGV